MSYIEVLGWIAIAISICNIVIVSRICVDKLSFRLLHKYQLDLLREEEKEKIK